MGSGWLRWAWPGAEGAPAAPPNDGNAAPRPRNPKNTPRRQPLWKTHAALLPVPTSKLPVVRYDSSPAELFRFLVALARQSISPASAMAEVEEIVGQYSAATRTVHVADPAGMRKLWADGFFGKGSLSRSEPVWAMRVAGMGASEEMTRARREERRRFKEERAREQAEAVKAQLRLEGRLGDEGQPADEGAAVTRTTDENEHSVASACKGTTASPLGELSANIQALTMEESSETSTGGSKMTEQAAPSSPKPSTLRDEHKPTKPKYLLEPDREHLDLTAEEALFLSFALGVLAIEVDADTAASIGLSGPQTLRGSDASALLQLFSTQHLSSLTLAPTLPPVDDPDDWALSPSNLTTHFLPRYAAYHHYRSLGWVVRDGVKFGTDLLLYYKGPAFSHAEFAVVVIPHRTRIRGSEGGEGEEVGGAGGLDEVDDEVDDDDSGMLLRRDWYWTHTLSRVQAHVFKTLVLAYVHIPADIDAKDIRSVGRCEVREFCVGRWVPARTRD